MRSALLVMVIGLSACQSANTRSGVQPCSCQAAAAGGASVDIDAPATEIRDDAWLDLSYGGGFAGDIGRIRAVDGEIVVSTERGEVRRVLAAHELERLRSVVNDVDWGRVPRGTIAPGCDLFTYCISVTDCGRRTTVWVTSGAAAPELRRLVSLVFELAYGRATR